MVAERYIFDDQGVRWTVRPKSDPMRAFAARAVAVLSFLVLCAAPAAAQQTTDLEVEVRVAEVRRLEIQPTVPTAPAAAATPSVLEITANVDWQLEAAAAIPTAVRVRGSDVEVRITSDWTPLTVGEAGRTTVVVNPIDATTEMSYRLVAMPGS